MAAFLVRVCLSYSFAQDRIEEQGDCLSLLRQRLPEEAAAELLTCRFTFGVFRAQASSPEACRAAFEAAWHALFPEQANDMRMLITPDSGDDTAELMRSIYAGYYGAEPYQALTTGLTAAIPLLRERGALKAVRMQNYLLAIDAGCGFSTLLSSFGDYLRRMQVYPDREEHPRDQYTEYNVYKETSDGHIGVDDLIQDLLNGAEETRNNVIGLDVSYFLDGDKWDELRDLVRRLYRVQDNYVFVFRVPYLESKALRRIEQALSDVMLLRTVSIPPLHDCVLLEFFWDAVRRMGFMPDQSVAELFFRQIRQEKSDGRFYGFKTAEKIIQQMLIQKTLHDAAEEAEGRPVDKERLCAADLPAETGKDDAPKSGYDALNELIGMETIRDRVREIVSQVKLALADDKLEKPCIHMRFLGAPGTGKTTVARIIGQIFREEGILRKGAFLEYSARSLCAEYVGQTAVKTAAICRDAYGSVLFIDEAYALYTDEQSSNDYGKEALTTLISEMENHRDDMLVIMAGYTDDMETLMKGNAGLRSRMPYALTFRSYMRDQLFDIFMLMVRKHFAFTPELEQEARQYFQTLSEEYLSSREFANARFVRNLYERTWSKGALRTALAGQARILLCREDFLAASGEKEFSERLEQDKRVGF
ncbi:MAG: AAA family ATPase [Clostridia bacterium]|nr:AAA family ATPase [Clostridia bacterium]